MKATTYFSRVQAHVQMRVEDYDRDHLRILVDGSPAVLNAVQVDKLRQQFHGWLHERVVGPGGANWEEDA